MATWVLAAGKPAVYLLRKEQVHPLSLGWGLVQLCVLQRDILLQEGTPEFCLEPEN